MIYISGDSHASRAYIQGSPEDLRALATLILAVVDMGVPRGFVGSADEHGFYIVVEEPPPPPKRSVK